MQAAVAAHLLGSAPENMFAPFTIVQHNAAGKLVQATRTDVHWGNVDTGAMVNIMYSGVLTAFPALKEYRQEFQHVVQGVGGKTTAITCKLANVPISIGPE